MDTPKLPLPKPPPIPPKAWRVTLDDGSTRMIEAVAFRVEAGALVLVLPAGCAAAYAPGEWRTIESSLAGDTA